MTNPGNGGWSFSAMRPGRSDTNSNTIQRNRASCVGVRTVVGHTASMTLRNERNPKPVIRSSG